MSTIVNAIPNTLGEVVNRCQDLMGDTTGRMFSRAYLLPFINTAYSAIAKKVKNGSGKNFEGIANLLNVAQGTSDLYPYQTYGNPGAVPPVPRGALAGMWDPIRMWVKAAGQLPQYFTEARSRDTLPHVNPPGITPGNYAVQVVYTWIGNRLAISPVARAIDIQVYGRFNPPRLVSDSDELVLYGDMTDTLALATCALAGVERSNPEILAGYGEEASAGVDNIVADVIRQTQSYPRRLAKMAGQGCGGGSVWGWG